MEIATCAPNLSDCTDIRGAVSRIGTSQLNLAKVEVEVNQYECSHKPGFICTSEKPLFGGPCSPNTLLFPFTTTRIRTHYTLGVNVNN